MWGANKFRRNKNRRSKGGSSEWARMKALNNESKRRDEKAPKKELIKGEEQGHGGNESKGNVTRGGRTKHQVIRGRPMGKPQTRGQHQSTSTTLSSSRAQSAPATPNKYARERGRRRRMSRATMGTRY